MVTACCALSFFLFHLMPSCVRERDSFEVNVVGLNANNENCVCFFFVYIFQYNEIMSHPFCGLYFKFIPIVNR